MKNALLTLIALIFYIQCRIVHTPIVWIGFPSLQMWITQGEMMKRHITWLIMLWINALFIYFFGWYYLAFLLIQIIAIFVIIKKTTVK
jgi:hypothetical protein